MKPLTDSSTSTLHVEAALQAVCAAIVTLEAAAARTCGVHALIGFAIGSLRQAIDELRQTQTEEPYALALGFVAGTGPTSSSSQERPSRASQQRSPEPPGHTSPRRTA